MTVETLNFAAAISDWARQTEARMAAVFRESAQRVIEDMQSRVPVDTGFLRASLQVTLDGPVPMSRPRPAGTTHAYALTAAVLAIAGAQVGQTIFASYGAAYAAHVNYGTSKMAGRQFVGLAAQRWPAIVAEVAAEAQSRASGSTPGT
jgi:hypothetical protein